MWSRGPRDTELRMTGEARGLIPGVFMDKKTDAYINFQIPF
jgi:hypothetical protein